MRSKAHTALTAPLVLHHTRIYKCAMNKFGINGQLRNKLFCFVIHRFSLVRAAMNALSICKMRSGVSKTPSVSSFSTAQVRNKYLRSYLNCCTIVNWKKRKRSNMMGGGRIFLKNRRASLFNDDLSNEPNFSRIHQDSTFKRRTVKE